MTRFVAFAVLLGAGVPFGPVLAQDVELLGTEYGTRPPAAYYQRRVEDPRAFRFSRAWHSRVGAPLLTDAEGPAGAPQGTPLGQRPDGISGTLAFPLILGLFSDSPDTPPYPMDEIQKQFFDGPNPTGTIPDYYADQSGGALDMVGVSHNWIKASLTAETVSGGVSGLGAPGRVGAFITEILTALDDGSVDWGQYDNDGPDGVPNSGDDDGYVDVLAVMHPTAGAECSGAKDKIWSHRWSLKFASGQEYVTSTQRAGAGRIRIDDYTIQPVLSCDGQAINEIGVFAHELGHGLGLPDLYDTNSLNGQHGAAGRWDLMATGSWGCRGGNPARPCDLGAWSKEVLGWLDVTVLDRDQDHGTLTLTPTNQGQRSVFRIEAGDGSNEYFLLENRSPTGYNEEIYSPGMLVWHIDEDVLAARWGSNTVNADADHMGVWLRAADGLDQASLDTNNRGDNGDPFPGATGNDAFHAGSNPASFTHDGMAAGVTLVDVAMSGDDVTFRAVTRFQRLDVTAGGTGGAPATVSVDGGPDAQTDLEVRSAPFQHHVLEASAGSAISPGKRNGFLGWEDGSPRIRQFQTRLQDSTLTAQYGGAVEVLMSLDLQSPIPGIDPGQIETVPSSVDGWFDEGADVSIVATERTGFAFREWTGDLAGSPNPASVVLEEPLAASALYDLTFGVSEDVASVSMEAAVNTVITLEAANANLPVTWHLVGGELPMGVGFVTDGTLSGTPVESGTFQLTVRATDAIGLLAVAPVSLLVLAPRIGAETLGAPIYGVGTGPTPAQLEYLDRSGNGNGRYDLGDFRAFVLANPELPAAAPASSARTATVTIPLRFQPEGSR